MAPAIQGSREVFFVTFEDKKNLETLARSPHALETAFQSLGSRHEESKRYGAKEEGAAFPGVGERAFGL